MKGCGGCIDAKRWLKRNGIEFKQVDVDDDEKAWKAMELASGSKYLPQIKYGKKWVEGYDAKEYKELFIK